MKTLDVQALHNAIDQTLEQLKHQSDELAKVKKAVEGITSLDDALKGKGGDAIRAFYEECHTTFLRFYDTFIEEYSSTLKKMKSALNSLEPNHNGFISQSFLEHELENGLNAADRTTKHLVSKTNATIAKVSHIVDLPDLNDSGFHEQNQKALKEISTSLEKLHAFDREQTNALKTAENDLETMQRYMARLEKMYTGPKIEITSYQKGAILKSDEELMFPNNQVMNRKLENNFNEAQPSPMKKMLKKLGNLKETDVDTLATPNRLKKLIEKYGISKISINNPDELKKLIPKEYQIKKQDVQVKKFEMPWGSGRIGKFGRASEIRKALTENPLKVGEASKVEKATKTDEAVSKVEQGTKNSKLIKFKGDEDIRHFEKHAQEVKDAMGKKQYNLKNYLEDANYVIKNGKYVPELNGYVKLIGGKGSAKYGFVGLNRNTGHITTFHVKTVKELAKKAPSLGLKTKKK
ncbi:LXG domain-containing protein [Bacillus paralicheniformis]|uniref:ribonuclease YeeF family protein n=1 Tax=Bacillus paralicheniformis TaxID=1648923 RepID=UPI002867C44D|nr:LXG domain-containing protein [Bacillus paralicheniformis]WMW48968.1 LXG domain-containing protein [Bacillus paralicheniformis]